MNDLKTHFGLQLRAARNTRKLSQSALAKQIGVGQDIISHYECGQTAPSLENFWRIACVLDMAPNYFMPRADLQTLSDEQRAIFGLLSSASPSLAADFLMTFSRIACDLDAQRRILADSNQANVCEQMKRLLEHYIRDLNIHISNQDGNDYVALQTLAGFAVIAIFSTEFDTQQLSPIDLIQHLSGSA